MPKTNSKSRIEKISPYHLSSSKRMFDLVLGAVWLCLAFPLLILIAIGIVSSSGFPIFFKQRRVGLDQRQFTMYKFRTMYVGAENDLKTLQKQNQAPKPMFKIFKDPRFVGIGAFLSKTGLDELPQLWNVIKGDMSLVGPRPLPLDQAKKLGAKWQFRFLVKPGIFSEWTVSKNRHRSEEDWVMLDRKTVTKGSWKKDLLLILHTMVRVIF